MSLTRFRPRAWIQIVSGYYIGVFVGARPVIPARELLWHQDTTHHALETIRWRS